jgi:hypothetical protein
MSGNDRPRITIQIDLEGRPLVIADCFREGDWQRLLDWIVSNDRILVCVVSALEAAEQEPPA